METEILKIVKTLISSLLNYIIRIIYTSTTMAKLYLRYFLVEVITSSSIKNHLSTKNILDLKFLLGTIWIRTKRTAIYLFQSEVWRCEDGSILTTQPLVSIIYSAFECKIQCSHILQYTKETIFFQDKQN